MRRLRWLVPIFLLLACDPQQNPARAGTSSIGGCPIFPADNVWNTPVNALSLSPRSRDYVSSIGADRGLKADFGSGTWEGGPIGIPFVTVGPEQPKVPITFDYADESDPGPYPLPHDAPIEGGPDADGDRHILVVEIGSCTLYEVYAAYPRRDGSWTAGSGAIFDLKTNKLRPSTWTSADAAGLPILAGLVRYDEILAGEIRHAIRFTAPETQNAFVWPARHAASDSDDPRLPPMGQRFRLRADFDTSTFDPRVQIILKALKVYGLILADNGSSWFMSGAPDERWNNDMLRELAEVHGSDFEAVDTSSLIVDPDSAQARVQTAHEMIWLPLVEW